MTCAQPQVEHPQRAGTAPAGLRTEPPAAATTPAEQSQQVVGDDVGVVVIGRNEGQRLIRALEAALRQVSEPAAVVYVDSGSTDGSPQRVREMGVTVVDLDLDVPFTAARARNAGFEELKRTRPQVEFVQFVDGDCELYPGWLALGRRTLVADPNLAVAAGRRREKYPERTIFNKLCDLEWRTKVGATQIIGGDAMIRARAFEHAGRYDPTLIAGEEPDLCVRLREREWTVYNDASWMSSHDADMHHVSQWWKRAVRFGHAATEVSRRHRGSPKRVYHRELISTFLWVLVPPLLTIVLVTVLAMALGGRWWLLGFLPLALYGLLALKVTMRGMRGGDDFRTAALYALSVTAAKFPQFVGSLQYYRNLALGRQSKLIEYKGAGTPT